ncbi:transposase [Mycoplasma sp. CSL10137]|uniref:IS1634 family transposase n=1 Tax=Mycoplasma sp. CSL10137 TaxID=2813824 RepID=UPI00197B1D5E|nr:transposase [Mycoplasma sp. CSL10137]MBN4083814.1 transposase [Mycoplasma sp. CSL10137]
MDKDTKYKKYNYYSHWKGKRVNDIIRRIITNNAKRASKDKKDRENLINNSHKKQKNKMVSAGDIVEIEKYKFYKKVGKTEFILDHEKVNEDKKYDDYYVFKISREVMPPSEIINIYYKQWQIEENFKTLKDALKIRPIYVRTSKHIRGNFSLNFISLVVLKYSIYLVNKFYETNRIVAKMVIKRMVSGVLAETNSIKYINDDANIANYNDILLLLE